MVKLPKIKIAKIKIGKISLKRRYTQEKEHRDNFLLLFALSFVWISSAALGMMFPNLGMLLFFIGVTLFKPFINFIRKVFSLRIIHEDAPLRMVNTCMTIGVPLGLIVGFIPFSENVNLFFPTFCVLFGIIFAIVGFIFHLKMYGLIALCLAASGIYIGIKYPESFDLAGFFTAALFLFFAIICRIAAAVDKKPVRKKKIEVSNIEKLAS